MQYSCKHTIQLKLDGMCKACAELKPHMSFRTCSKQCFNCNQCGWFWGPEHLLAGTPVKFEV